MRGEWGASIIAALRIILPVVLSIGATFALIQLQGRISLGDVLLIGVVSSVATAVGLSFLRAPAQFIRALFERIGYMIWVPLAVSLMLAVVVLRIAFVIFKLLLKALVALVLAVVYLVFPLDLFPDFFIGLGQIDDILIIISVVVWVASSAAIQSLKASISVRRPITAFP